MHQIANQLSLTELHNLTQQLVIAWRQNGDVMHKEYTLHAACAVRLRSSLARRMNSELQQNAPPFMDLGVDVFLEASLPVWMGR